ncbi:cytochrome c oxidase accessory protein CcoG [bacterium]|nr:cytochrome c oxidase accessory protein CcoG [bacterium]
MIGLPSGMNNNLVKIEDLQKPPETSATIGSEGRRNWVYSDVVFGRFIRWRDALAAFLILFYLAIPWIKISGSPLLRFDVPGRRFHIFGGTFVATDLFLLALFMLIALVGLFWFSAVFGRLWCGWACPQTVYLEGVFRRIERWIEGTPLKRRKLDSGPKDADYWMKKIVKHGIFWGISTLLALSFTAYFIGPEASYRMFVDFGRNGHATAMIIAVSITAMVYFDFAWFREQFCHFLCPYARIQSVFLDDDSLVIGYDPVRGEPRGPLRKDAPPEKGDCIDCKRCVQVCPAGIDIRDGLQLECVQCTACIDACDMVMEKIGKPMGLVRYDSVSGLEGRKRKIARPRVIIYSGVLVLLLTVLGFKLADRSAISFAVVRQPGTPYIVQDDGFVRNMLHLNITNTSSEMVSAAIVLDAPAGAELLVPGQPFDIPAGDRITAEAFIMMPKQMIRSAATDIRFHILASNDTLASASARFLGPVYREK